MIDRLRLFYSQTGRLYVFLGKREYVSCDGVIEDVKGVANMPDHEDFLKGKEPSKNHKQIKNIG